jgi:hypothetical protein
MEEPWGIYVCVRVVTVYFEWRRVYTASTARQDILVYGRQEAPQTPAVFRPNLPTGASVPTGLSKLLAKIDHGPSPTLATVCAIALAGDS